MYVFCAIHFFRLQNLQPDRHETRKSPVLVWARSSMFDWFSLILMYHQMHGPVYVIFHTGTGGLKVFCDIAPPTLAKLARDQFYPG